MALLHTLGHRRLRSAVVSSRRRCRCRGVLGPSLHQPPLKLNSALGIRALLWLSIRPPLRLWLWFKRLKRRHGLRPRRVAVPRIRLWFSASYSIRILYGCSSRFRTRSHCCGSRCLSGISGLMVFIPFPNVMVCTARRLGPGFASN